MTCQARTEASGQIRCTRCRLVWDAGEPENPCPLQAVASPSLVPSLETALRAAAVSSCGLDITIACDDHNTKDAILNALTGVAFVSALAPDRWS